MKGNLKNINISLKKVSAAFLLSVFLFSSLGFTINYHYCPYKGSSVSFTAEKDCCCSASSEKPDNCCKNKAEQVKINDNYQLAKTLELKPFDVTQEIIYLIPFNDFVFIKSTQKQTFHYADTSPPGASSVPLFIFNRSILV
jgi:hypothetical protein